MRSGFNKQIHSFNK